MGDAEIERKVAELTELLRQSDGFENNVGMLNLVLKTGFGAWSLIDPVTGAMGVGAKFVSEVLDSILGELKNVTQQDIDSRFKEIIEAQNERLEYIGSIVLQLVPHASLCYENQTWSFDGHGISSITNYSNEHIAMNFIEPLANPNHYIATHNMGTGVITEVTHGGVDIYFPSNCLAQYNGQQIKVVVNKMVF